MKKISIFIAGSTELDEEMTRVKATVSDLVQRYGLRGYRLEASNFENHGDFQTTYDDFIRDEADIVLFILEGSIGRHTEKEFVIAMDSYAKNQRPEVYVFVKPGKENDDAYQHLLGVVRNKMSEVGQYYVKYTDIDDLENKVRSRLDRYLLKRENAVRRTRRWGWITAGLVALAAMVFPIRENCEIVYVGGGSVANYLRNHVGVDVNKDLGLFRKTIYTRLPSGAAWTILSEDVNLEMLAQRKDENKVRRSFIPVCLSAGKIDIDVFQSVADTQSRNKAAIIECYLGEDPLTVYMSEKLYNGALKKALEGTVTDGHITNAGLSRILRGNEARIFATNKDSGTRKMYASVLQDEAYLVYSNKIHLFNEASPFELVEPDINRFVILGSENYRLNALEKTSVDRTSFVVVNDHGVIESKGMYLYFMAYRREGEDSYQISPRIKPLLRKLEKANYLNLSDDIWEDWAHLKLKRDDSQGIHLISIAK